MKLRIYFTTLLLMGMAVSPVTPQTSTPRLDPFGLQGKRVTVIAVSPRFLPSREYLYAASEKSGVFRRALHLDSTWINLGLEGKRIEALDIQVWGAGPGIFHAPLVGTWPDYSVDDSTPIYRFENNDWIPSDSGITRTLHAAALVSFASGGHEPPGFAFASFFGPIGGLVYRSHTRSHRWELVFGSEVITDGPSVNALAVNQNGSTNEVWIGGYTGLSFQPWIAKSIDMGSTWQYLSIGLNLGIENGCHAFAFDPNDPGIVYAGMDGTVIKTTDGGKSWRRTGLRDTLLVHFVGLALDPFTSKHLYACGRGSRQLWESIDAGMTWQKSVSMFSLAGITRIVADPNTPGVIYIATAGDGVWRYQSDVVAVKDRREVAPQGFALEQNYPNPFATDRKSRVAENSGTIIRFEISAPLSASQAHLAIYNLRGEFVRELLNKKLPAGNYAVQWDGRSDAGSEVAAGIYFYQLRVGNMREVRKLSLVK